MGKHFLCTSACIKNKTKIKNISKRKRNLYMVKIEVPVKNSLNYKVSATYLAKKVSLKFVPLDYFMLNNKDARKKKSTLSMENFTHSGMASKLTCHTLQGF